MRGVWVLWHGPNTSMYVHRVSHCSWTQNTKVVWMADNWPRCPYHSMDTDKRLEPSPDQSVSPLPLARFVDQRWGALQEVQETRDTVDLPTASSPPGFQLESIHECSLGICFYHTSEKKNPHWNQPQHVLNVTSPLPVLKLEISVPLQEKPMANVFINENTASRE